MSIQETHIDGQLVQLSIEGFVEIDPYGPWDDCSPGVYVGGEMFANRSGYSHVQKFKGKRVRVTIEVVEDEPIPGED